MKQWVIWLKEKSDKGGLKKDVILLLISGLAVVCSLMNISLFSFDMAWIAIVLCGVPIVWEAIVGLVTAFDIKADVLVSLALIASVLIGEEFAAGEVAFIMQLGALLEELTVSRARKGIEKLVDLTPQTARVIENGKETVISAEKVKVDDIIRVLPGETIPVDGVILSGQTSVNQAVMTGESLPVDKTIGDEVSSGTVNQFGAFDMKATRIGENSSIQRMIQLVKSAEAGKAKIVGIADRWATWIVVIALASAMLAWLVTGEVIRAVTVMVVFCPCALVLATPTAIMAAIGNAAKHGFLIRQGDALERFSCTSKIIFDKTGTLTCGEPEVVAVDTVSDYSREEVYAYTAAAEQMSEHPLGKAIVRCYRQEQQSMPITETKQFQMFPGEGVSILAGKKTVKAGNYKMIRKDKNAAETLLSAETYLKRGSTVVYLSVDDAVAGYVVLSDTLRKESETMIRRIQTLRTKPILLTGDHSESASAICEQLGITEFHANCLPEDKLAYIKNCQKIKETVCMIGDGINDAPALKMADVGIAMGGIGSDIAVDSADIVLVDDEIKELPHLLALSKRMMTTIKENMIFSMSLNFIAILLAITGKLNPVVGALVHNAGSVLVIANSALLMKWKKR